MDKAFTKKELIFPGRLCYLLDNGEFSSFLANLCKKGWVVYSKESFVEPEYVLDYLGPHRVAISNNRFIAIEDNTVTFSYKDRKDEGKIKSATLPADAFIRRFLLHVLRYNFFRIRYFGFLATRYRKENITLCRKLLGTPPLSPQPVPKPIEQLMLELCGVNITLCPLCGKGIMKTVEILFAPSYENRLSNLKHQFNNNHDFHKPIIHKDKNVFRGKTGLLRLYIPFIRQKQPPFCKILILCIP